MDQFDRFPVTPVGRVRSTGTRFEERNLGLSLASLSQDSTVVGGSRALIWTRRCAILGRCLEGLNILRWSAGVSRRFEDRALSAP